MSIFMRTILCLALPVVWGGMLARPAWSQFDEMARHVPGRANSLCLINAERLFASAIAKDGDWQQQRGKRFESGLTSVPPNATHVVIASQLDLEVMHTMWDVAIIKSLQAPTLAEVAKFFGGIDDTIGGTPALRVADDSYVVRLSDTMLGAFGPANRQLVASWLRQSEDELSPYLQQALGYGQASADVILAIDVTHVLSTAVVQEGLESTDNRIIKNAELGVEEMAKILSSLRGIMLGITFGKTAYGRLRVDFEEDATPLANIAKPLLLEALGNHGAMIDEFEQWQAETKGKTIYLSGTLDESGLTRVATLINLPTHALQSPVAGSPSADTAEQAATVTSASDPTQLVLETTQQYYRSINHLITDLKGRQGDARTFGQIGTWLQNYANKIDRLPILNVDEEMLQFGMYVSQQLRNASSVIKGSNINKHVAQVSADMSAAPAGGRLDQYAGNYYAAGASSGYYGRPLGWGAAYGWARNQGPTGTAYWARQSEMRQAFANRAAVNAQFDASMATSVQGILAQLREANQEIRVTMSKKYQVEF
jgi:hypothetical protein